MKRTVRKGAAWWLSLLMIASLMWPVGSVTAEAEEPPVNFAVNAGFELDGLNGWLSAGTGAAAQRIGGTVGYNFRTGQYALRHLTNSSYETWTYQTISGLADGLYSVSAWVRRPQTVVLHELALMEATAGSYTLNVNGTPESAPGYTAAIPTTTQAAFSQIAISNVVVAGGAGQVTIAFHSKASAAGPVLYVDDVELVKTGDVAQFHTVMFETYGGSAVAPVQVGDGLTLTLPDEPHQPNYQFEGWYTDPARTERFDENEPIVAPLTLYANWTAVAVNPDNLLHNGGFDERSLDGWNVTASLPDTVSGSSGTAGEHYYSGSAAAKLTQSKRFEGWLSQTVTDLDKGYYTLKAKVRRPVAARADDVYAMQLGGHGFARVQAAIPQSAEFSEVTLIDVPIVTGAATVEFYVKSFDYHLLIVDDVELIRQNEPFPYNAVTFDSNGGTDVPSVLVPSAGAGSIAEPEPPRKTGYTFAGWYTDANLTAPFDFGGPVGQDTQLYAKWVQQDSPMIGAIRWDVTTGYAPFAELQSLSLPKYHYRAPYFTTIDGQGAVTGNNNSVEAIEREIGFAEAGGIDYWAFTTGPELGKNNPEYYALDKFLSSDMRDRIGFAVILHRYNATPWENRIDMLVKWMQESNYVQVLGDRPLLYIYRVSEMEQQYGAGTGTQQAIALIRSKAQARGLGNPYIVAMASSTEASLLQNKGYIEQYGLDAISAYGYAGERTESNLDSHAPFRELATQNREAWERYAATGKPMIPLVSIGRNEEPRKDTPVVYGGGHGPYFANPTPYETASHIRDGLAYAADHPQTVESNGVLVYAWNEFAEGGWIAPTLSEGRSKLDAIYQMKLGATGGSSLLNNADFESGLAGWSANGGAGIVSVTASVYYRGDYALHLQPDGVSPASVAQTVAQLPAGKYRLAAQFKAVGGGTATAHWTLTGSGIGGASASRTTEATGQWQQLLLDIETAAAGSVEVRLEATAANGGTVAIDALEFYSVELDSPQQQQEEQEEQHGQATESPADNKAALPTSEVLELETGPDGSSVEITAGTLVAVRKLIVRGWAELELDAEQLAQLDIRESLTVRIGKAGPVSNTALPQEVEDRPAVALVLEADGKPVQTALQFRMKLPYVKGKAERDAAIVVYRLEDGGRISAVVDSAYNPEAGTVEFAASSPGTYAIGYHEVSFRDTQEPELQEALLYLGARGIVNGTDDGTFSPEAAATRGQFAAVLCRAYGIDGADAADTFADSRDAYYSDCLAGLKQLGVASGVGGNNFAPERELRTEEMLLLTFRLLSARGLTQASEFTEWSQQAMERTAAASAEDGRSSLSAADPVTRSEMARFLYASALFFR